MQQGNSGAARQYYWQILKIDRRQPQTHNRLGIIASESDEFATAVYHFSQAVKYAPNDPGFRGNYGVALARANDIELARIQLQQAMQMGEHSFEVKYHLAACEYERGASELALETVNQLLQEYPDKSRTVLLRGQILLSIGEIDSAETIFKDLIEKGEQQSAAYYQLSLARKSDHEPKELSAVEDCLASGNLSDEQRTNFHFAAGKFASDCGQYDRAFHHYVAGNKSNSKEFDIGRFADLIDGLIDLTSPEFFAERQAFGDQTNQPIFIFGMPRSGTTLTEQIIGSHPDVTPIGEINHFLRFAKDLGFDSDEPSDFLHKIANIGKADARALAKGYFQEVKFRNVAGDHFVDKMPHNFQQIWLISLVFPHATYIHAMRHPIDTCMSCFTNKLNQNHSYATNLDVLGRYYRLYDRITKHWEKVAPVKILRSRYEDLVNEPDFFSRKLVGHTGLEWNEACARHYAADTTVRTLSIWQVRQPVYNKSVNRWRRYEKHIDPLKESLGDVVTEYESM